MIVYKFEKYSNNLGYQNFFEVLVPEKIDREIEMHIIYCLHGMWGNQTDFERYNIDLIETNNQVLYVFVNAHNSYYLNCKTGEKFKDYVGIELHNQIIELYNLDKYKRSIVGISMGGYGAMYLGLTFDYCSIANLSGAVDIKARFDNVDDGRFVNLIDEVTDDLKIEKLLLKKSNKNKKIYSYCGTNDFLYKDNEKINKIIKENIIEYKIESDEGDHSFKYWNKQITSAIKYIVDGEII